MFKDNFVKAMQDSQKTLYALSKETGISSGQLHDYKIGRRIPKLQTCEKIAKSLNVSVDYLFDRKEQPPINQLFGDIVTLRVISSVRAGYDGEIIKDWNDEKDSVPLSMLHGYPPEECCLLIVKGDSMYPKILDGDKIIIHIQPSVDSGDTAVVVYNGNEGTVKKVKYVTGEDWVELIPANPEYPVKRIEGENLTECIVFGKVIGLYRSF